MISNGLRAIACGLVAVLALGATGKASQPDPPVGRFEIAAVYAVSGNVAEIVDSTPDGRTLVYTDSESEEVGFVDISDPAAPVEIATVPMPGEPTSVAITPDGAWALVAVHGNADQLVVLDMSDRSVVANLPLGGQPDSVAISGDGRYAAIAIENERDEDVNDGEMPQAPPGLLTIVDLVGPPAAWPMRNVLLVGLAGRFASDPEPEFVSINSDNIAAVTLQENNHVVLVRLADGSIVDHWSAGTTTHAADTQDDGVVAFDDVLSNARREPDAIVWTPDGNLLTANEGDYDLDLGPGEFVGGRDFTVFSAAGSVVFEPGGSAEIAIAAAGRYDDRRSDAKGCELEGAEVGEYLNHTFAFIGAERCASILVYRLKDKHPKLVQVLPTGDRPEGLAAIPSRGLFVSANEGDGTIWIYRGVPNP